MSRMRTLPLLAIALAVILAILYGSEARQPGTSNTVSGSASRQKPALTNANELGVVPIIEYHLIGRPEGAWRRTPENFRRDLQFLYDHGYYPVKLQDYVAGKLDVPAGRSPVVLTFDDSSEGQFRAVVVNSQPRPDPESAVGIMESFAKKHPDFPATATFFLLPAIDKNLRLFGQPEFWSWKLNFLVQHGYELGNHTYWHQNLAKATPEQVREQLAKAQAAVNEFVPEYRLRSLSLPYGVWPTVKELAVAGTYQGISYRHNAILLVGAGPAPSPADISFNSLRLPRIQAGDGVLGPAETLLRLEKKQYSRYISDGNPKTISIPMALKGQLRRELMDRAILLPAAPNKNEAGTKGSDAN